MLTYIFDPISWKYGFVNIFNELLLCMELMIRNLKKLSRRTRMKCQFIYIEKCSIHVLLHLNIEFECSFTYWKFNFWNNNHKKWCKNNKKKKIMRFKLCRTWLIAFNCRSVCSFAGFVILIKTIAICLFFCCCNL